eukprot:GGOE01062949.1.p1 GENE.GGOE01062949.1~~GGOE01062949.1.p1  ORF type:complete len:244 (+),score=9.09 GGOE01062949.1:55-786(+)
MTAVGPPGDDVCLSREQFSLDDCEVVLIGIKGNFLPYNDNCRSRRLHCCSKCEKPIVVFGRLMDCKHAFCETCALIAKNESCFTCGESVREVHPFSIEKGDVSICEFADSKGVCQRIYMTPEDLLEHQRLRNHLLPPREEDQMLNMCNAKPLPTRDHGGGMEGSRGGVSNGTGTSLPAKNGGSRRGIGQSRSPYSRPAKSLGYVPAGWTSPHTKSTKPAGRTASSPFTRWTPRAAVGRTGGGQ